MRDLKIKPALNGYICIAGCQTLIFTSAETMLAEIGRYLKNPCAVEKEYIANAVNKMDGLPMPMPDDAYVPTAASAQAQNYPVRDLRLDKQCAGTAQTEISVNGIMGFEAVPTSELR